MPHKESDKDIATGDSDAKNPLNTAYIGTAGSVRYLKLRGDDISADKLKRLATEKLIQCIRGEGGSRPYLFKLEWLEKYLEETQGQLYSKLSAEQTSILFNQAGSNNESDEPERAPDQAPGPIPADDIVQENDVATVEHEKITGNPEFSNELETPQRQSAGTRMQIFALTAVVASIAAVIYLHEKFEQLLTGNTPLLLLPLVAAFITIVITMVAPSVFLLKYKTIVLSGAAVLVLVSGGLGSFFLVNKQGIETTLRNDLEAANGELKSTKGDLEMLEKKLLESNARLEVHQSWMNALSAGPNHDDKDAKLEWSVSVECMPGADVEPEFFYTFANGEDPNSWEEFVGRENTFTLGERKGSLLFHRTKSSSDDDNIVRIEFDGSDRFRPHLKLQAGFVTLCANREIQLDGQQSVVEFVRTLESDPGIQTKDMLVKLLNKTRNLDADRQYSVGTEIVKNAIEHLESNNNYWLMALGQMQFPWKTTGDGDIGTLYDGHQKFKHNPVKKKILEEAINNHHGLVVSCKAMPLEKANDGQRKHSCFKDYLQRYESAFDQDEILEVRLMSAAALLQEVIVGKDPSVLNLLSNVVTLAESLVSDIAKIELLEKDKSGKNYTHALHSDASLLLAFSHTLENNDKATNNALDKIRAEEDPVVDFALLANGSPNFVKRKLTSSIVTTTLKKFSSQHSADLYDVLKENATAVVDNVYYISLKSELDGIVNTGYGVKLEDEKISIVGLDADNLADSKKDELAADIRKNQALSELVTRNVVGSIVDNIWYLQPISLSGSSELVPIIGPTEAKHGKSWTRQESCSVKQAFIDAGFVDADIHSAFGVRECGSA